MSGIDGAFDRHLALHEDPFRTLEIGGRPDPTKPAVAFCPVSGKTSLADAERSQPITVEYLVDSGSRASSTATEAAPSPLPYWCAGPQPG